jgi:hypothetical protein
VIAKAGDVGRQDRRGAILTATPADNECCFLDALVRLARAAGELPEHFALKVGQRLTHRSD